MSPLSRDKSNWNWPKTTTPFDQRSKRERRVISCICDHGLYFDPKHGIQSYGALASRIGFSFGRSADASG